MSQSENRLNEECNLVLAGTHEVYIRPDDFAVFVAHKKLQYHFYEYNAFTLAKNAALEAKEASGGCFDCPLKPICNPESTALKKDHSGTLTPAQKTSFIGLDVIRD